MFYRLLDVQYYEVSISTGSAGEIQLGGHYGMPLQRSTGFPHNNGSTYLTNNIISIPIPPIADILKEFFQDGNTLLLRSF
jgi:hypothetical protein